MPVYAVDDPVVATPESEGSFAWSADGRVLAVQDSRCMSGAFLTCNTRESRLLAVEVATGRTVTVASSSESFIGAALSDDGAAVAYSIAWSGLHVRPTGF